VGKVTHALMCRKVASGTNQSHAAPPQKRQEIKDKRGIHFIANISNTL